MVRTFLPQPGQEEAQVTLARRMFWAGCLGLPWLHAVNVWYFWPKAFFGAGRGGGGGGGSGNGGGGGRSASPELKKCELQLCCRLTCGGPGPTGINRLGPRPRLTPVSLHTTTRARVTGVSRSLVGAIVGFALLAAWVLVFQLRWKAWGSRVLPFMITTPEQYSTGW